MPGKRGETDMAKTRGSGLWLVWADIDPEFEAEYHRWYDEEPIAHLLAVPGFLSAGRYVALKGGPKYLALYELEAPDVLRSPAFLDGVRFRPSTRRVQYFRGTIGRQHPLKGHPPNPPPPWKSDRATPAPPPGFRIGGNTIPA